MERKTISYYLKVLAYGLKAEMDQTVLARWMENDLFHQVPLGETEEETWVGFRQMNSFRRNYLEGKISRDQLNSDYLRLFIGAGHPLAPPWGSYYLNEKHLLFQDETASVRKYMEQAGWSPIRQSGIPEDFIAYELEFMAEQLMKLEENPEENSRRQALISFLESWVLSWVSKWNQQIQIHAEDDFYPALGNFVVGSCRVLKNFLEDGIC